MSWLGSTVDFLKEQAQRQRAEQARQSQEEKDHYKEHSRISVPLFPEPPRQKKPSDDDENIQKVHNILGNHGKVKHLLSTNSLVGISQIPGTPQVKDNKPFSFPAQDSKTHPNGKAKKPHSSRKSQDEGNVVRNLDSELSKGSKKESSSEKQRSQSSGSSKEKSRSSSSLNNSTGSHGNKNQSPVKHAKSGHQRSSSEQSNLERHKQQPASSSRNSTSPLRKPHKSSTTNSKLPADKPSTTPSTTPTKNQNQQKLPTTPVKTTPQKNRQAGDARKDASSDNSSHVIPESEEPFKNMNGVSVNGVLNTKPNLKVKIHKNGSDTTQDVDDILKEMTGLGSPVTAIQTPHKERTAFFTPLGGLGSSNNGVYVNKKKQEKPSETGSTKTSDIGTGQGVSSKTVFRSDSRVDLADDLDISEDSDNEKISDFPTTTPTLTSRPGPTTCKGGVGSIAPVKEPRSSMSSDSDSSSSDSESSDSGTDDSEDSHASDDGRDEQPKVKEPERPKTPPIKSPPPTQEQEQKSWALTSFIHKQAAAPLPTNASFPDRRPSGSPYKEDPNDELLKSIIHDLSSTEPESKDDEDDDDDVSVSHTENNSITDDHSPRNISNVSSARHSGKSPVVAQNSFGWGQTDKTQMNSKHQSGKNSRTTRVPKKEIVEKSKKAAAQQGGRGRKKSKAWIDSDSDSDEEDEEENSKVDEEDVVIDVEYVTPEKMIPPSAEVKNKEDALKRLEFPDKESVSIKGSQAVKENERKLSESKNKVKYNRSRSKDKQKDRKMKRKDCKDVKEHKICEAPPIAVVAPMTMTSYECENNISNTSIDKDMQEIMQDIGTSDRILSPIPNEPEKSKMTFERLERLAPSPEKSQQCMPQYEALSYKEGRPCIMVHLDKSLLSQLIKETKTWKKSNYGVKPSGKKRKTDYMCSETKMDVDCVEGGGSGAVNGIDEDVVMLSPESKLDSSFSSQQSSNSVTHLSSVNNSKKLAKRKMDSDRHESSKRQKGNHRSSSQHRKTSDSNQKEKVSHTDDHEWDRKHPARSRSNSKERHNISSSHHSNKHTKITNQPSIVIEDSSKSDSDEKEDQLSVVPQGGEPHPASVETYNREGDGDVPIHPRRLEDRLEPADVYLSRAKELKHDADNLTDKLAKSLMYTEAVLSFIQCGYAMEREALSEVNKIFTMYRDTYKLITHICRFRSTSDSNLSEKEKKLAVLSFRIQSLLCLKLFKLKKTETLKFKRVIDEHNKTTTSKPPAPTHAPSPHQTSWNRSTGTPSPMSPTPSPSGSIGSVGSQGSCNDLTPSKLPNGSSMTSPGTVAVPQRIHSVTQQYLNTVSYLVQCHEFWDQADQAVLDFKDQRKTCKDFFDELDEQCGTLSLHSSISDLVLYVQSGLQRLKDT